MTIEKSPARYSRRSILKYGGFGLAGAAFIVACGDDDDETPEPTATTAAATGATGATGGTGAEAMELSLISGWYKEREVRYYDFGMNTPLTEGNSIATAPIYVFITGMDADGNPQFVDGQHNVVGVKPGDEGYSDLWQVMLVTVPSDYTADDIKSAGAVMEAGYEVTETTMFVNCPIVAEGTTLEGGEPLVQGWYNDEAVFYPDFGANPPAAIPIWAFTTGMDAEGNPQFVDGQNNIIDSVPEDAGYSAFWRVNLVMVDEDYEANSVKSADGVREMEYTVQETDLVVNCPVTMVL